MYKNDDNCISGVTCTVNECTFYKSGNRCAANCITVHGNSPSSSEDTECETFEPKNY